VKDEKKTDAAGSQALEAYFREAASWDADRAGQATRRARLALAVAAAGWLCAVASSASIALLTPLKTVTPFLVRVDNTTGLVDVVPVYAGRASMPEVLTRYLLKHYIDVCERFNFATAESDYEECGAFHSARRNGEWSALWATANPSSPLNLYKDGSTIRSHVTSISFFKRANGVTELAQVRYVKGQRSADGAEERLTHWIATIQYAYVEPSKDPALRQLNPLGFRIVDFRPEPETLPDLAKTLAEGPPTPPSTPSPSMASERSTP
jgi:type IV secretion system protein VirB8